MTRCPYCDAPLESEDVFCRACGASVEVGPLGLDWVWVIYGTALITTFQFVLLAVAGMSFLGDAISAFDVTNPDAGGLGRAALYAALMSAGGYLIGGILVGRMSAAHTILEPAISAGLPAAALLAYVITRARHEFSAAGVFWKAALLAAAVALSCFLVALLGGFIGERWQDLSRQKKSRDRTGRGE
jgi:hypothetical protein